MEEAQKLLGLIRSEDAELRRYALSSMEMLPGAHEEDELLEALRLAGNDPMPLVRHQANRTLSVLLARKFAPPKARGPAATAPGLTSYEGIGVERLAEAGWQLLAPLIKRLSEAAVGKDAEPAQRAVMALGRIGTPQCVEPLRTAALNPITSEAAIAALAAIKTPRAAQYLLAAARHEYLKIKAAAILNLGLIDTQEARDLVVSNSNHAEPTIRSAVAGALQHFTDKATAVRVLTRMADDEVSFVALDAVRTLSFFSTKEAVSAVCDLYRRRKEPELQASAIASLGFQKSAAEAVEVITEALRTSNTRIRANAVEALARLPLTPQDLARILNPLQQDPNNRVRGNIAVVMVRWAPDQASQVLDSMLASENVWMRASAAWALGRAKVAGWQDRLTTLLAREQEFPVLSQALRSLEGSPDTLDPASVYPLLDHGFAGLRSRAATLLGLSKRPGVANVLIQKVMVEADATVRSTLVQAIGQTGTTAELSVLNDLLLRDPEPRVKAAAVEALGQRRALVQVVPLYGLLASTDQRLKANIAIALFSMGGFRVIESLLPMLQPLQPRQFASAAYAVGELGARLRLLGQPDTSVHLLAALRTLVLRDTENPGPVNPTSSAGLVNPTSQMGLGPLNPTSNLGVPPINPSSSVSLPPPEPPPAAPAPASGLQPPVSSELAIERIVTAMLTTGPAEAQRLAAELLGDANDPMVAYLMQRVGATAPGAHTGDEALVGVAQKLPDYVEPVLDLVAHHTERKSVADLVEASLVMYERQLALLSEQLALVRALARDGKHQQALAPIEELARWVPVTPGGHRRLGRSLMAAGERVRGFHHLSLAHLTEFWNFECTYDYAIAATQNAQFPLARELCAQIMRLAPAVHPIAERTRKLLAELERAV